MSPDAFKHTLYALCNRRPFRPFVVELDDGTRLEIDQPHAVLARNGTAVFLPADGKPVWFDHMSVIRMGEAGGGAERTAA